MKKNFKYIVIVALTLVLLVGILYRQSIIDKSIETISYNDFLALVESNKIEEVKLSDSPYIHGILKDGSKIKTDNPRNLSLKEVLLKDDVKVVETTGVDTSKGVITAVVLIIGFVFLAKYMSKSASKQTQKSFEVLSSMDKEVTKEIGTTFNNVAGNTEAKESVKDIVDFIQNPEKYTKYGARMPRGIIFYGPPGTGKTLMAKAVAGEAGVPFYSVSGSDFVQIYAGLGAGRIRDLFKKAREKGKCVIFIDEIDSLGKKRTSGSLGGASDEKDQTLNALLAEMSGFNDSQGIVVIGATNRLDILDEALLRPGRFDRHVEVQLPDKAGRYEILKLHGKNKPFSEDVNLNKVAEETVYFSGAKLENLLNEAAIMAAKDNNNYITQGHIDKAFYTVIAGGEKQDRSGLRKEDRITTAYHEAGHALITKLVAPENKVSKVTIIPSTKGAGGFSMNISPDRMYYTKKDLENSIMIALGGRCAEEIVLGKENITTGASNDIERATEIVLALLKKFGMGEDAGILNYELIPQQFINGESALLREAKEKINTLYMKTKELLIANQPILGKIVEELLEKETLNEEQLNFIIQGYSKDIA